MANNTQLNAPTTSGDTLTTDDITTSKTQAVKLQLGATTVDGGLVTVTNPLPGNITQFASTTAVVGSGNATGALRVELPTNGTGIIATVGAVTAITNALPAGTNAIGKLAANSGVDIGDVDVITVPADPFGVNADAASATGSISAKLRFIAATGIPITSSALPSGAATSANQTAMISPGLSASATFTPAASSHVANDVNGGAQQISINAISAGRVMITDASLEIDGATAEATAWNLYLYNVTPPSAYADDAAWDLGSGDRASFLGVIQLGTAVDYGSTLFIKQSGLNQSIKLAGTTVYAYLVNLTTLTPANVAHIVTLHCIQI